MAGRTGALMLKCTCQWVAAAAGDGTEEKRTVGSEVQLRHSSSWRQSALKEQHCQVPGKQGREGAGRGC